MITSSQTSCRMAENETWGIYDSDEDTRWDKH